MAPEERADLERLAQYIIRNPFFVEKMQVTEANKANPDGSIIYHSGMNPKIQRNPSTPLGTLRFSSPAPDDFVLVVGLFPGRPGGGRVS